jgi:hypothetical protein
VDLEALGDFPAGPLTSESLDGSDAGQELVFTVSTRQVAATTSGLAERFLGLSAAPNADRLDALLWPEARSCELAGDELYPAPGGGQALAYNHTRNLVLVAGGDAGQSSAVVGALTFDVTTGRAHAVDAAARHVLLEPRAYAASAAFGDDFIVTGGENPVLGTASARPVQGTGEVYVVADERFSPDLITLRVPRTRHVAAVLPSGEVLLVGGRGEDDAALAVLEALSPETRSSSLGGLASLAEGRIAPHLVQLSNGEFLVGGGVASSGQPVSSLEWLSPDASRHLRTVDTERPAYQSALVALPGGAALYVAGCAPTEDDATCAPCARGCPTAPERAALWIREDGTLDPVELPVAAPSPTLVAGDDGSPWLFSGSRLFRFNPWRARFEEADLSGDAQPAAGAALSLDPGAFVWLSAGGEPRLQGVRTGTRDRYARDVALLTLTAPNDSGWPLHLCPGAARTGVEPFSGSLELTGTPVWLTDADFADFDVELVFDGATPVVWLSASASGESEHAFGAPETPWPEPSTGENERTLRLERRGARVALERGGARVEYTAPSGRVSVGWARALGGDSSHITQLAVARHAQ